MGFTKYCGTAWAEVTCAFHQVTLIEIVWTYRYEQGSEPLCAGCEHYRSHPLEPQDWSPRGIPALVRRSQAGPSSNEISLESLTWIFSHFFKVMNIDIQQPEPIFHSPSHGILALLTGCLDSQECLAKITQLQIPWFKIGMGCRLFFYYTSIRSLRLV